MPEYRVEIPETHYATYKVEAASPEAAKMVLFKNLDDLEPETVEFSHCDLNMSNWNVTKS